MSIRLDYFSQSSLHQIQGLRTVHHLEHVLWLMVLERGGVQTPTVQCAEASGGGEASTLQLCGLHRRRSCTRSRSPRWHALPQPPPVPIMTTGVLPWCPHPPVLARVPELKGHWKKGDWICWKCNNHNYASRLHCNRCSRARPED